MASPQKGKERFAKKAGKQLGNALSITSLLSDDVPVTEEPEPEEAKSVKTQKRESVKAPETEKPAPQEVTPAKAEAQPQKAEPVELEHTERQSLYFSVELDDLVHDFMRDCTPREKNKNRFIRGVLHYFFSKTEKEQKKIYEEILVKYKNKIG